MDTEQIVRKESMEVVDDDGHQRTGNQLSPLQKSFFFFSLCDFSHAVVIVEVQYWILLSILFGEWMKECMLLLFPGVHVFDFRSFTSFEPKSKP